MNRSNELLTSCWILSSPRTGGNYLSSILNETKLFPENFDEWLHLRYRSSATEFLKDPPHCLNIHWAQFRNVFGKTDKVYIDSIIPEKKYIVLKRNSIDQAASFYTAMVTKTWRIHNDKELQDFRNRPVPIDPESLIRAYRHVIDFADCWKEFEENQDSITVNYEELLLRPEETVSRILSFLSIKLEELQGTIINANLKFKRMNRPENEILKRELNQMLISWRAIS
jgi:LPS sulfotransferase NodH